MKKIKILIILIILLICPKVKAECDTNLNLSLANNVEYSYTFSEFDYLQYFSVTLTNLQGEFYVKVDDMSYYGYDETTIPFLTPGKTYNFEIYSENIECSYLPVRTIEIELPYYNKYYKEDICSGIDDLKYCNKWTYVDITYSELQKKVEEHGVTQTDTTVESIGTPITKKITDLVLKIYARSYFIVLPLIIIILLYKIYKLDKKENIL
jgi:hypothetical protein